MHAAKGKPRNQRLKARRRKAGMSAIAVAREVGISHHAYMGYETLRCSPLSHRNRNSAWRKSALAIAKFWGVNPEEVFPPDVRNVAKDNPIKLFFDDDLVQSTVSEHTLRMCEEPSVDVELEELRKVLERVILNLSDKEQFILRNRFGYTGECRTLEDIGNEFGVTKECIRHHEQSLLEKLRRGIAALEKNSRKEKN